MLTRRRLAATITGTITVLWFLFFRPGILGGSAGYVIVSGVSMQPTLYTGDLAITRQHETYNVGDVIAFRAEGGTVIHRIVGGSAQEGYLMRGDNRTTNDDWRPQPEQIVGKMWFRIPTFGRLLTRMQQPRNLGVFVAAFVALPMVKKRSAKSAGRRANRRRLNLSSSGMSPRLFAPDRPGALAALVLVIVLAVGCSVAAVSAFRAPTETTAFATRATYQHSLQFGYTVHTFPSVLYPDGVIAPTSPISSATNAGATAQPIFTKLARSIDIDMSYAMKSNESSTLTGEMRSDLQISAKDGWQQTLPLTPVTPFNGVTTSAVASVDLNTVENLVQRIEDETGFTTDDYQLAIVPTVAVRGTVGAEQVNSVFVPAFRFELGPTMIVPDQQSVLTQDQRVGSTVHKANTLHLIALRVPVRAVRFVGTIGTLLTVLLAVLLAAILFLGLGRGENARIAARYRSMLVAVNRAEFADIGSWVEIASIQDLAKLAQREGLMIFHYESSPSERKYFVSGTTTTYQYTAAGI